MRGMSKRSSRVDRGGATTRTEFCDLETRRELPTKIYIGGGSFRHITNNT